MINPITAILAEIYSEIPKVVLDAAFEPDKKSLSLDECIMQEVIRKRVLIKCNALAGKLAKIPVLVTYIDQTIDPPVINVGLNRASEIYRIPPDVRENRNISTVLRLTYVGNYSAAYPVSPAGLFNDFGDTVGNLANMALNSRTMIDANITPKAELLSGNMIRITPPIYNDGLVLECLLEYDEEFTNISMSSIVPLQKLVLCATKAWIYNKLIVDIDLAMLSGGQIIGVVKQIVDSYEGEREKFNELFEEFRGSTLFDPALSKYMILNAI